MENLFIANSKFNLEKLKENKAFLLDLMRQIKEAFIIGYYKERDEGDKTTIEIGSWNDAYNNHTFSVDGKGVISFDSTSIRLKTKIVERLHKKYPNSRVQMHPDYSWINLDITNITKSNINEAIKDITLALETAGHAPAFTLRR